MHIQKSDRSNRSSDGRLHEKPLFSIQDYERERQGHQEYVQKARDAETLIQKLQTDNKEQRDEYITIIGELNRRIGALEYEV